MNRACPVPGKVLLLSLCLLAFGPFGRNVLACDCTGGDAPARAALSSYDAVFFGRVTSIKLVGAMVNHSPNEFAFDGDLEVTVEVRRAWKGVTGATAVVHTQILAPACGYPFQVGEYYLIYAKRRGPGEPLVTGSCSPTEDREQAFTDMPALGAPSYEPK